MWIVLEGGVESAAPMLPIEHWPTPKPGENGVTKNWPPETKAVFGLPPEAPVTREVFAGLLHPEDVAKFETAYAAALAPDSPRVIELVYRIRRANDGAERWIKFNGYVTPEGDVPGKLIGMIRDVTEERAALERNAQNALLLPLFVEHSPTAVAMFDREMRYLSASARWRSDRHLADSPVGRSHYEVFPEIGENWKAVHRRSLAGAVQFSDGEKFVRADGTVQWVKWESRPWRDSRGEIGGIIIASEDITAQKRAEEALRDSEAALRLSQGRLRYAADAARLTFVDIDLVGRRLRPAENYEKVMGYRPSTPPEGGALEPGLEALAAHVAQEDRPRFLDVANDLLENGAEGRIEFRLMGDDGAERWIECAAHVETGADGQPARAFLTNLDITDLARGRNELKAAKQKADEILASIADGFYALDANWRFVYFNRQAEVMLGKAGQEVLGRGFFDVFPMVVDSEFHARCHRVMTGKQPDDFETISPILKRWVRFSVYPTAEGGISIFFRDISEQKAAEEALRKQDTTLRLLADAMPQLAWFADPNGYMRWYNKRWYEYTGTTPEQMEGWGWQSVHDPGVLPEVMRRWTESISTGRRFDMTFPLRGADGKFRPFLTRVLPELDAEGRVVRWFGTNTEVTEQKQLEEALRAATQEAERANLAKSRFIASASHDLRQPAQSLVLLHSVLELRCKDDARAVGTLKMMGKALGGLTDLLTAILDISRLDAGLTEPRMETVDLGVLLDRLIAEARPKAADLGLELRWTGRGAAVHTDPALCERALRNLIENALRYTAKGGVLIGLRRRGHSLRVDVVDTGVGIAEEKLSEIFEEFSQLDNPGRDLAKGLGLGLAVVARVASLISAVVEVSSRVGRGSRFSLTLPLAQAPAPAAAPAQDQCNAAGAVMVVEDNFIIRCSLEELLSEWGYRPIGADSGEEALDLAARGDADFVAIITDYRLGAGLNGIETALQLEQATGRNLPKLVITGDTAKERLAEISASGCEFLHKPVETEELRVKLAQLLGA